jgi:predicted O-linked N-acetylglucosamine transferase (SPINDLY family)
MPTSPSHAIAQAQSLLRDNKPQAALLQLQRLLSKHPSDPGIHSLIAGTHLKLGRPDQALYFAQGAANLAPDNPGHLTNLGIVLLACGQGPQAVPVLRRALALQPRHQETILSLANALLMDRQPAEALELCRAGLAISWHAQLALSCAGAMHALGEYEESLAFLNDAIARSPEEPRLAASLAQAMVSLPGNDPATQARAHRAAGAALQRSSPPAAKGYTPPRDPLRPLRVAIVSPDLRQHSVVYFLRPLLEEHDRASFEITCCSNNLLRDEMTDQLRSLSDRWRDIHGLSDAALVQQCGRDRVDIAIDLAGYTQGHRLGAFAARLAPIQITYLGYPDSTGLTQMDYRIVDALTDPPGTDDRCTEKLIRLDPCFLCWKPPADAPAPDSAFRVPRSGLRFGSFNDARKNNPRLFSMWSQILAASPGSTLALKSMNFRDPAIVQRTLTGLAAAGVSSDRVHILQPAATVAEHLAQYSQIDIALDPAPYNGTTTTCEALWMGVPVVTLAGNRHAGRVGVSLLTNAGLPGLVARNEDDYVRIATDLAADASRLADLRSTLRQRMAASTLCDAAAFARRFESALRKAWADWCAAK